MSFIVILCKMILKLKLIYRNKADFMIFYVSCWILCYFLPFEHQEKIFMIFYHFMPSGSPVFMTPFFVQIFKTRNSPLILLGGGGEL